MLNKIKNAGYNELLEYEQIIHMSDASREIKQNAIAAVEDRRRELKKRDNAMAECGELDEQEIKSLL
jgi:hypothetical protein